MPVAHQGSGRNICHWFLGGEDCFSDAKKYNNYLGRTKLALKTDNPFDIAELLLPFLVQKRRERKWQ